MAVNGKGCLQHFFICLSGAPVVQLLLGGQLNVLLSIFEHLRVNSKGNDIYSVNYSLVTCDFSDSGVFADLMIATLFRWHTQQRSDIGFITVMWGTTDTRESKTRCMQLLWCWLHRLIACILPTQPFNSAHNTCVCACVYMYDMYTHTPTLCACMYVSCVCVYMFMCTYSVCVCTYLGWVCVHVCNCMFVSHVSIFVYDIPSWLYLMARVGWYLTSRDTTGEEDSVFLHIIIEESDQVFLSSL